MRELHGGSKVALFAGCNLCFSLLPGKDKAGCHTGLKAMGGCDELPIPPNQSITSELGITERLCIERADNVTQLVLVKVVA